MRPSFPRSLMFFCLLSLASLPLTAGQRCTQDGDKVACMAGEEMWIVHPHHTLSEAQAEIALATRSDESHDGTRDAMMVTTTSADFPYLVLTREFVDLIYDAPTAFPVQRFKNMSDAVDFYSKVEVQNKGLITAFDGAIAVWYEQDRPRGVRR